MSTIRVILLFERFHCRCNEDEFDQFVEVDLSYQCSPSLTTCYDTVPALHNLISNNKVLCCYR